MTAVRIGAGAGFANDRIGPAVELVKHGNLHYLGVECLAERTLAQSQIARRQDPSKGYTPRLERRFEALLPVCRQQGTRIVTNMGSANPAAAGAATVAIARKLGLTGIKIAVVEGDDVAHLLDERTILVESGKSIAAMGRPMISANAYIGIEALMPGLESGADVVIAGRAADSSLFLAPLAFHFGWASDAWAKLAQGAVAGHLLECTGQVTGGYFADPGYKNVPGLDDIGFPFAEVDEGGDFVITKLAQAGGCVTVQTVKEQLLYEVHDPAAYKTPDVTANFSTVRLASDGANRIAVSHAGGGPRPDQLKVTVGFDGGFLAEAEISYAGPGAFERAVLGKSILTKRIASSKCREPFRIDMIGVNSIHGAAATSPLPTEDVRVRLAMRTHLRENADLILEEVECLCIYGPAGGGGYRGHIVPSVTTYSTFVDRERVKTTTKILQS